MSNVILLNDYTAYALINKKPEVKKNNFNCLNEQYQLNHYFIDQNEKDYKIQKIKKLQKALCYLTLAKY